MEDNLNTRKYPADAPEYSIPTPQPYACSDDLAALLENLRANQSLFFRTKNGTIDHANAFQESKRLEKELDQFLKARKEEKAQAPNLFSL